MERPTSGPANPVKHSNRFFIDGHWIAASSAKRIDVINPATEDVFYSIAEAQETDVDCAVRAARAAFDGGVWPRMPVAERASYLRRIGLEVAARSGEFADIWSGEVGALNTMGRMFVPVLAQTYEYYAHLADSFQFEELHVPQIGQVGLLVREPVGVVAAIVPWNGPLLLINNKLAPALLAGCTVVLKSSPEAPGTAYLLAEIAEKIGLPPGVLNVVTADRAVSEYLVRHPGVDKIAFTGSSAAGMRIASICGERLARVTLELGGKSPAIILDDYDLDVAAQSISQSARVMTGQVCASLTRVILTRDRHDAFAEALGVSFSAVRIGDPYDAATEMGPLAMRRQRDRVENYIARGKDEGAKLITGGGRPPHLNRGFFIEPTVFANVDNNMSVAREEIFGPVLCVIPAADEGQAIEIANDTAFGLNATVFTNDVDKAYALARQIRSGTVGHNGFRSDFGIGFGGFKQSGIGREGGVDGLHAFLEAKTIILEGQPGHILTNIPLNSAE